MQGQEALSWKGTEEMSQEEEPRNRIAQQMWCGNLGNTSGHTKKCQSLCPACPLMVLDREGREIGNIWVCFVVGFFPN